MDMLQLVLAGMGLILWLSQLINVAFTDGRILRSPKHKLMWFAIVLFFPVIGALFFIFWKRQVVTEVEAATRKNESTLLAKGYDKQRT